MTKAVFKERQISQSKIDHHGATPPPTPYLVAVYSTGVGATDQRAGIYVRSTNVDTRFLFRVRLSQFSSEDMEKEILNEIGIRDLSEEIPNLREPVSIIWSN